MSDERKTEVKGVNKAIEDNKELEKMVKQVISSNANVSKEGKEVLSKYFSSVHHLNQLFAEKLEEPVVHNNKTTKDIRDKKNRISKKKYVCDNCTVEFGSQSALADHICNHRVETSSEAGSEVSMSNDLHQCHICSKVCSKSHYLNEHMKMHANDPDGIKEQKKKRGSYKKQFSCEYCGKKVTSQGHLNKHITHVHKNKTSSKKSEKKGTSDKGTKTSKKNSEGESRQNQISDKNSEKEVTSEDVIVTNSAQKNPAGSQSVSEGECRQNQISNKNSEKEAPSEGECRQNQISSKHSEKEAPSEDGIVTNSPKENPTGKQQVTEAESRQKQMSDNSKTNQEKSCKATKEVSNSQDLQKTSNSVKSSVPVVVLENIVDNSISISTYNKEKHKANTKESTVKKQIKCDACQVIFESQPMYDAHKVTCVSGLFTLEKNVCCDICPEKFFNVGALNKHKEHTHN